MAGEKEVAGAAVKRAEAQVARAELNLSYTEVKAPISGRIGRNRVDVGNLVGEAGATVLTEVTRYDPMYVYFNLNERDLLRLMTVYRQRVKDKGLDPANDPDREAEIKLFLGLADEAGYPHEGVLDFGESGLDPGTGTLQLRGTFENAQLPAVLIPGLFARVRFPVGKFSDRPLVTERAIGADQGGRFLLVVNDDGTVEKRNITLGQLVDGLRVVHEGLQAHDWVVVNGVQRARPGAKVDPEQIDMALLASSALEAPPQAGEADPGGSASGTAND
jgi:RND family efflux transporter MFP subunit